MTSLARNTDPETSHEAALNLDANLLERLVLETLLKHGPLTSEGVADLLKISLVSISPRFRPLVNKGKIADTGVRAKNKSGRSAILWRAIPAQKGKVSDG